MLIKIYALSKEDGKVRYVGQTRQNLNKRKRQHKRFALVNKRESYKDNWIRKLYREGGKLIATCLETCDSSIANGRETYWIEFYRLAGVELTNLQPVGKRNYRTHKMKWSKKQLKVISNAAKKSNKGRKLPILQYNLDGLLKREFDSVCSALRHLKKPDNHHIIKLACNGELGQLYGYMWRYKNDGELLTKISAFRDPRHKRIVMMNKEGKELETFKKIRDAVNKYPNSVDHRHISDCCTGKRKTHGGYRWKYL